MHGLFPFSQKLQHLMELFEGDTCPLRLFQRAGKQVFDTAKTLFPKELDAPALHEAALPLDRIDKTGSFQVGIRALGGDDAHP